MRLSNGDLDRLLRAAALAPERPVSPLTAAVRARVLSEMRASSTEAAWVGVLQSLRVGCAVAASLAFLLGAWYVTSHHQPTAEELALGQGVVFLADLQ